MYKRIGNLKLKEKCISKCKGNSKMSFGETLGNVEYGGIWENVGRCGKKGGPGQGNRWGRITLHHL